MRTQRIEEGTWTLISLSIMSKDDLEEAEVDRAGFN